MKLSQDIEDIVGEMYEDQYSISAIIKIVFDSYKIKISKSTIYRVIKKRNL